MTKKRTFIFAYFSKIMSLPIIGLMAYSVQRFALKNRLINFIILSNKPIKHRTLILQEVKHKYIICKTIEFGDNIMDFDSSTKLIFDAPTLANRKLRAEELYNLMWTLVRSDYITSKAGVRLQDFIYKSQYNILENYNN